MLTDILKNRIFIGALAFFVLSFVGGSLYIWHVERQGAEYSAETQAHLQQWEAGFQQPPAEPSKTEVPVGDTSQGGHWHGDEWHATPHAAPAAPSSNEDDDFADAFLPENFVSEEEDPAEVLAVSPHGFGPYPKIPEGYRFFSGSWAGQDVEEELLERVMIKAWTEGESFLGANFFEGKVLLNYINTIYVRYRETQNDDGSVSLKRFWALDPYSDYELSPDLHYPPTTRILDVDEAGVGIDPYEYLNLP